MMGCMAAKRAIYEPIKKATRGHVQYNNMGHPDLSVGGSRRFREVFSEGFGLKVVLKSNQV